MQVNPQKSFHVETDRMSATNWQVIYLVDSEDFVYLHIVKPKNILLLWKAN